MGLSGGFTDNTSFLIGSQAFILWEAEYDMDIAVMIPCYNEELTIAKVIKDFKNINKIAD